MRFLARLSLCIVLSIAGTLPAFAGTSGIVEGTVRNARTGELLPGVNVHLIALHRGTVTDAQGRFTIANVRIGSYEIRFTLPGFRPHLHKNVLVTSDLRTRLQISLEESDVQLDEIVVVQERPLIQTDVTATTFVIRGEELRALRSQNPSPTWGRSREQRSRETCGAGRRRK